MSTCRLIWMAKPSLVSIDLEIQLLFGLMPAQESTDFTHLASKSGSLRRAEFRYR